MDILAGLNSAQREAVETASGPLLIIAGPGSGKTRVIAHRIAYLIGVRDVHPRRIMAVTFTNKAAGGLRERLDGLLGAGVGELTLGTFHSICSRILRVDGEAIGVERNFVIYDDDDQLSVVKQGLVEVGVEPRRFSPRGVLNAISAAKSQFLSPHELPNRSFADEVARRAYERYEALLTRSHALDFNDLLLKVVKLFQNEPDVLAKYQARYVHLLVDEFQDTNITQYQFAKLLGAKGRNICVVGDPDQSIYGWRFADIRNILSFEQDFPDARVVVLGQNYRSTQTILEVASHIIVANRQRKPKELWTENPVGNPVSLLVADTEDEEARMVAAEIERLQNDGVALRECAVMYRTNAQSRVVEEAFLRFGIPYKLVGAVRFYHRREVKDVLAYLRLLQNPQDTVSLLRVINLPPRGIGNRSQEEIAAWAQAEGVSIYEVLQKLKERVQGGEPSPLSPRVTRALLEFLDMLKGLRQAAQELDVSPLLHSVLERTGYEDFIRAADDGEERWDNIQELRSVAEDYPPGEGLTDFLEKVGLVSDVDNLNEATEGVTLITLHQAKGLEYDVVFIVGAEDGVLPHFRSFPDPDQMEEERRLCYVGVTRARHHLYLLRACHRSLAGMSLSNPPSRFLDDVPGHLLYAPVPVDEAVRGNAS
ncbi:MAG: UvrD-helicase domain-containing protein, partial [Dehalococcoidia bacterium]|nr:UvrD-helicase domain-containing protein [Dehalococcoidia bacterium]